MAESQEITTQEAMPQEQPTKLTPDQFREKLQKGEIEIPSGKTPEEAIAEMVDFEEKKDESQGSEPAPEAQPAPIQEPQPKAEALPQKSAPAPQEAAPKVKVYKGIGDLLEDASTLAGEKFENAHDMVQKFSKSKKDVSNLNEAVKRWQTENATASQRILDLEAQLKAAREAKPARPQQQQPEPKAEEMPDFDSQISEPDRPDEVMADASEWAKYYEKCRKRDSQIANKRMGWLKDSLDKQRKADIERMQKESEATREKIRKEEEGRLEQQRVARHNEEAFIAANDFVSRHQEFAMEGTVQQNNAEFQDWIDRVELVQTKMPAMAGRDLAKDYLNGVPDAVQALDQYAVYLPANGKKMALISELYQIAKKHGLMDQVTTRPNFDEAYALKKRRDGVDVEEVNQAAARGAERVLEVVQNRQAAPPQIGAQEAVAVEEQKQTPEQLSARLTELRSKMSIMSLEERTKAMNEVTEIMGQMGLQPTITE